MAHRRVDSSDTKRALARGGSDAAPPRAKAKGKPSTEEFDEEMEEDKPEMSDMQYLITMVKEIKTETKKLDKLEESIKDIKGELNGRLDAFEARLKAMEDDKQVYATKVDKQFDAINQRMKDLESKGTSSQSPWVQAKPPESHRGPPSNASTSSTVAPRASPDELVITGFGRDTHRDERSEVVKEFMSKLPTFGPHFRIDTKFLHSNLCFLVRKEQAPQAVVQQLLEEFNKLKLEDKNTFEHKGASYTLHVRRPVPPARLKRNAILKQATEYIEKNGKNITEPVAICWLSGVVKHGKTVLFACDFEDGRAYYEALLQHDITKDALSKALERPTPSYGKRL